MFTVKYDIDPNGDQTRQKEDHILLSILYDKKIKAHKSRSFTKTVGRGDDNYVSKLCPSIIELEDNLEMNVTDFLKVNLFDHLYNIMGSYEDFILICFQVFYKSSRDIMYIDGVEGVISFMHETDDGKPIEHIWDHQDLAFQEYDPEGPPRIVDSCNIDIVKLFDDRDYSFERALTLMLYHDQDFYLILVHKDKPDYGLYISRIGSIIFCPREHLATCISHYKNTTIIHLNTVFAPYISTINVSMNKIGQTIATNFIALQEKSNSLLKQSQSRVKKLFKDLDREKKIQPDLSSELDKKYLTTVSGLFCRAHFGLQSNKNREEEILQNIKSVASFKDAVLTITIDDYSIYNLSANISADVDQFDRLKELTSISGTVPSYSYNHMGLKDKKIHAQKNYFYHRL